MDPDAERIFDHIGQTYDDCFATNLGLKRTVDRVLAMLPAGFKVLDVGCGAGRPVAEHFARGGAEVHGIDLSQNMIDICSRQVKGHFEKADMLTYVPRESFDVVVSSLSIFELKKAQIYSMIVKFSEWLKPGGLLVIATRLAEDTVSDPTLYDPTGDCVRHCSLPWMGYDVQATLLTQRGWLNMFEKAGLTFREDHRWTLEHPASIEAQYFVISEKTVTHSQLGPYPLPDSYPGPHTLSGEGWTSFAEHLLCNEPDMALEQIKHNTEVLAIKSGQSSLPVEIAKRAAETYSIQLDPDQHSKQEAKAKTLCSDDLHGPAEIFPYSDRRFDSAVALWVLDQTEDLDKFLREITRVVNPLATNARIVLTQGAPDNEMVNLLNRVCAPLSARNTRINHQGYLLHRAIEIFSRHGFGDISLHRSGGTCQFLQESLSARSEAAAKVLAGLWYLDDPNYEKMQQALIPELELHFRDSPNSISGDVHQVINYGNGLPYDRKLDAGVPVLLVPPFRAGPSACLLGTSRHAQQDGLGVGGMQDREEDIIYPADGLLLDHLMLTGRVEEAREQNKDLNCLKATQPSQEHVGNVIDGLLSRASVDIDRVLKLHWKRCQIKKALKIVD
ncbi:hypothetical protein BBP40_007973 [Aspergillus hancockii]|nr:hypothetical protein BBP40_007973 [Aspergillus hancockii]